jgi:hypothetical protein
LQHADWNPAAAAKSSRRFHSAADGRNQAERRLLEMAQSVSESVSGSQSQSLSGSVPALLRFRDQHRGVRSCTVFDSDCDCNPDADTDRYFMVLKNPFLFGKDFQVSSTDCTDETICEICGICGSFSTIVSAPAGIS